MSRNLRARTNPTLTGEALREVRRDAGKKGGKEGGRGRPKQEVDRQSDDITVPIETQRGNSKPYILRRLAAEHPDTLAAYESGAFPSAAAAGRAAGILPPPDTPRDKARKPLLK